MIRSVVRTVSILTLVGCSQWLGTGRTQAQAEAERVPLIMTKLPPRSSALYNRLLKLAGEAKSQVLTLTKTEMWAVPKENVDAVKTAAAELNVGVNQLGTDWNHVFNKAPADVRMSDTQNAIVDRAKASRATLRVNMMAAPTAPMVEYALTKDADRPEANLGPAKILVRLSDDTILTIVRSTVDIIPAHRCTWRGTVEGTGAPVTIMWWPGGKMTGNLQHDGKIYSVRHMGGDMHAIVEMAEDRMPLEHAPMPERMRANDPNLRDDPLASEGDASIMKPKNQQKGGQLDDKQQQRKLQRAKVVADQRVTAINVSDPAAKNAASKDNSAPKDVVIDVIVAYTKKAANNYSDVKRELVELSIEEANESFRQSGIGQVKLRLVHTYQTDYVEEGAHFDHV